MTNLRRIGEQEKCPACGSRLDAEAYRCPKCFIYFCYKCRARVTKGDPQFQCADQSCNCYGKLLCAACTVMVPEYKDSQRIIVDVPSRTISKGHHWGIAAIIVSIGIGVWLSEQYSFWWGGGAAMVVLAVSLLFLRIAGLGWFPVQEIIPATCRTVSENSLVAEHRCCIQCKHPTKNIG